MKKIAFRFVSLAVSALMLISSLSSCTDTMEPFEGDLRDRYDYNLKEYVEVGEYKGLKIKIGSDNISQREIQARIMDLTVLYTATTTPEWTRLGEGAVAEKGHIAEVKFQGYIDDEPMSDLVHSKEEGLSMALGADRILPGVDEQIIGMKIGEKKTVEITVPDPCYKYPNYVGKTIKFELELAGIRAAELEPYGEGLFEYNGCSTADQFEAQVISEIKRIRNEQLEDYVITRAVEMIFDEVEVKKYPEKELNEVITSTREADVAAAKEASVTFEEYISSEYGMTSEEYDEYVDEYAHEAVKSEMVTYYIARNEKIALTNAAFDEKATELAEENGLMTPGEFVDYMGAMGYSEFAVRELVWTEMVKDFIMENVEQVKEG